MLCHGRRAEAAGRGGTEAESAGAGPRGDGGGPGLGLAIARGIVEAHGGRIWAESTGYSEETFPGSKFFVSLPVEKRAEGTG